LGLPGNEAAHARGWEVAPKPSRRHPLCKGGIRDITGIRGRDRAVDAMIVILPCWMLADAGLAVPNLIVDAPSLTGQLDGDRPPL
jgi:hypothetical protein